MHSFLSQFKRAGFSLESRVHALKSFGGRLYIKRDDELSFLSNGSKLRKYETLLPYLKEKDPALVALKGSALSNHITGLTPLLKEWGLPFKLFLKRGEVEGTVQMRLLARFEEEIVWIEREEWSVVDEKVRELHEEAFIVPVGGDHFSSLPGAMTLASDILRNEEEWDLRFETLLIDAGTGHQAISLLLGLALLSEKREVDILLVAGTEAAFEAKLQSYQRLVEERVERPLSLTPYTLRFPTTEKRFGPLSQKYRPRLESYMKREGLLLDPVYMGKQFLEIEQLKIKHPTLLIHTGGVLSTLNS